MNDFRTEIGLYKKGYKVVALIDEAGRGPLAGPVVAACVIWEPQLIGKLKLLKGINDSKKLTNKKREQLYKIILEIFPAVGTSYVTPQTIDKINILQATFRAMKKAVANTGYKPDIIIVDGKQIIPHLNIKQISVIKADQKIICVAAASIIAKVTRDRIMDRYHCRYSCYGFDRHRGYGTKKHIENLRLYGPCPIHRRTFKWNDNKFYYCEKNEN